MNDLFTIYDRWNGIVPLVLGVYLALVVNGYLPKKPKQPERLAEWRRKFGPMMQWLAPLVILTGVIQLAIGFSAEPQNPSAKRVFMEFQRANETRVSRGTTFASAAQFLADLKKIETSDVPPDLRTALTDYIRAFDDGLKLLQSSQPTTAADAQLADAKQRLGVLERKYLH